VVLQQGLQPNRWRTPVFLLSGIAALLNVFASRLARVADQAKSISKEPKDVSSDEGLKALKLRSRALDGARLNLSRLNQFLKPLLMNVSLVRGRKTLWRSGNYPPRCSA